MASDAPSNFLRTLIESDLEQGRYDEVVTRFPPEPNGYLHIGHAKSICLNFGLAADFDGRCHLRFDDTNPEKEEREFIEAMQRDIRWLGFDWGEHLYHASDYFEQMYELAQGLIEDGLAYVDSQSEEEIRATRGTVTEPGTESPYRDRPAAESLDLFRRMRAGEFPDGAHVLRAKIDMAHPNMKMRDPLLYRIRHAVHPHRGEDWCIYPFYDYAHCLEDAIEGVTHSFCTLEFENNRAIYDWLLDHVRRDWDPRPYQHEFARLNLGYTIMSKRKLGALVAEGRVDGWDDPRMPTIAGLRRRGCPPSALRAFAERVGVAKANSTVDPALLEATLRDDLDLKSPRVMAVLDPLEVVIDNYPEGETEFFDVPSWPRNIDREGSRPVPFARRLWIERDDFMEQPSKGFWRLAPGREVRLRNAYFVTCTGVDKSDDGEIVRLHCTYDPDTRGGAAPDGRKVKGTLHWVSAEHAIDAEVRLVDRLFEVEAPGAGGVDFREHLNPESMPVVTAKIEPSVVEAEPGSRFQFERQGYFYLEPEGTTGGRLVFNRIVSLKDSWAKRAAAPAQQPSEAEHPAEAERSPAAGEPSEPERPPRTEAQQARFARFHDGHGIAEDDADLLARDEALADLLDEALAADVEGTVAAQGVANWLINDLQAALKEREAEIGDLPVSGTALAELVALQQADTISSRIAKDVFEVLLDEGGRPEAIVTERGWTQVSDREALEALANDLIVEFTDRVQQYRDGRTGLLGFFMGQVMQRTQGKADPVLAKEILQAKLEG